ICKQPEWKNFKQVILMNESYRYSHHYYYSQTISLNQPPPFVNGHFMKLESDENSETQFLWKYYGRQVDVSDISSDGFLNLFENNEPIGQILNVVGNYESRYLLTQKEFFAARWSLDQNNETTTIVTNLIYANGKISVYYDNILSEISEDQISGIRGIFQCET
ncbi:unnamed protein product, partial [Schistosoma bovis]